MLTLKRWSEVASWGQLGWHNAHVLVLSPSIAIRRFPSQSHCHLFHDAKWTFFCKHALVLEENLKRYVMESYCMESTIYPLYPCCLTRPFESALSVTVLRKRTHLPFATQNTLKKAVIWWACPLRTGGDWDLLTTQKHKCTYKMIIYHIVYNVISNYADTYTQYIHK